MRTILNIVSYPNNPDKDNLDNLELIPDFIVNIYEGPVFTERHNWLSKDHIRKIDDMCKYKNLNLDECYRICKSNLDIKNIVIMDSDELINDSIIKEYKSDIPDNTIIYFNKLINRNIYNKNRYRNVDIFIRKGNTISNPYLMNKNTFMKLYKNQNGQFFKNKNDFYYNEELGFTQYCFHQGIKFIESKNIIKEMR